MTSFLEAQAQTGSRGAPPREYLTAKRIVTPAELLAVDASPIEIIPAPGVGRVIVPTIVIVNGQGGTPYDQSNGNLALRYRSALEGFILIDSLATKTEPFLAFVPPASGIASMVENDALVLATDAPGSGELTDGDYAIELRVEYEIVEL